jgi:hypothetical protein
MIVVAIIGILSVVAIPNFKKYQSKSKADEATLQLAIFILPKPLFMLIMIPMVHALASWFFSHTMELILRINIIL